MCHIFNKAEGYDLQKRLCISRGLMVYTLYKHLSMSQCDCAVGLMKCVIRGTLVVCAICTALVATSEKLYVKAGCFNHSF